MRLQNSGFGFSDFRSRISGLGIRLKSLELEVVDNDGYEDDDVFTVPAMKRASSHRLRSENILIARSTRPAFTIT